MKNPSMLPLLSSPFCTLFLFPLLFFESDFTKDAPVVRKRYMVFI
jgi:hypothetical protein